ncbi:MAG: aspartate kinase [Betaproteobacteria bacterium AqS2]|uniref:Aspartokinase n=1 Tax=Candidatus Amphirhobacter heronislandensis TaxID=1732024 RepID=A0A930UEW4_9GAMM|nr:aspartate kinase [Betaproteobacteria bacterium AqS2]
MDRIEVIKFGGSSLASVEHMRRASRIVLERRRSCGRVVVVVSAMGSRTNELLDLAYAAAAHPDERELDVIASSGEVVSAALFATLLRHQGQPARSVTAHRSGIATSAEHGNARIEDIDCGHLNSLLDDGVVPVVAGFQGLGPDGEVTTIGRGGSDTTAAALGHALRAAECLIYTDVPGIFTTDPRICPQARVLARVHYEEILELAALGARVIHPRAVEFAGKNRLLLRVLSTAEPERPGTVITFAKEDSMDQPAVTGIAYNVEEAKITLREVPDKPGIAASLFAGVAAKGIDVDMIVQNTAADKQADISFTVHRSQLRKALAAAEEIGAELKAKAVEATEGIAKISLVGAGMRGHAGIASRMFQTLAEAKVNILMISTSEIKVSVIIDLDKAELAVRKLHKAFGLDAEAEDGVIAPARAKA